MDIMESVFCLLFLWCLCSTSQESHLNELSLIGKKAIQSESVHYDTREANFAIDGDVNTFSYSESIEDSMVGWWEVDLGGNYDIIEVSVTPKSGQSGENANDEQPIEIWLLDAKRSAPVKCIGATVIYFPQQETKSFRCNGTNKSLRIPIRYVKISKVGEFKKAAEIAIAEFRVIAATPAIEELKLKEKTVSQSKTWKSQNPELAIDGDESTYSVSASEKNPSARGWWEIELGGNYQIGQVIITASSDEENAKYLQIFSIWLIDENETKHLCYKYTSKKHIEPSETKTCPCQNYLLLANRVRIARDGGDRQDAIALAEVQIKTGIPPSMIEKD